MIDSSLDCYSLEKCPESSSSGIPVPPKQQEHRFDYEKAKHILQMKSCITGENLFDHLVNVIKRVIDERPVNVIDYFEQLSRDVREQKHGVSVYSRDYPYKEPQFLLRAQEILKYLKILNVIGELDEDEEHLEVLGESQSTIFHSSESSLTKIHRYLAPNENVLQFQHFFSFCGLGFKIDEIFQLSWAMQNLQFHHSIQNARFWGRIYGLKQSYYIVEALLTNTEVKNRNDMENENILKRMKAFMKRKDKSVAYDDIDVDLIPGSAWQHYTNQDLEKMQPPAKPIPQLKIEQTFEAPSELFGTGLNRMTYFVATSLSGKWIELPKVAPEQIKASRLIKKYLTGNLEASLGCFPLFPGTEKNYLRAMIARITSSTYIAPNGFYEKKKNKVLEDVDEEELEDELDAEVEGQCFDNDALVIKNTDYVAIPPEDLALPKNWTHIRPNILHEGRVLHIDEQHTIKELERKVLSKIKRETAFEVGEEEEKEDDSLDIEETDGGDEKMVNGEERPPQEIGPELFALCSDDKNDQFVPSWTSRYSSIYNKNNQMIIMRSNLWPGAYTFAFDNFCESTYVGWGLKYVARCTSLQNVPSIQDVDFPDASFEVVDPTTEMEEKWRRYYLKNKMIPDEEISDISVEFDADDFDDETM